MIIKCKIIEILQTCRESNMYLLNIVPWLNFDKCIHKQCLCKNVYQYYLTYPTSGLEYPLVLEYLESIDDSANSTVKIFSQYIKELVIQDIQIAKQLLTNLTYSNIESRVHYMYEKLYGDKISKPIYDTLINQELELGYLKYGKVNLQLFGELVVKAIDKKIPIFKILQYFDTISGEGFYNMDFIIKDLESLNQIELINQHPYIIELSRLLDALKQSLKNLQDPNKYDNFK